MPPRQKNPYKIKDIGNRKFRGNANGGQGSALSPQFTTDNRNARSRKIGELLQAKGWEQHDADCLVTGIPNGVFCDTGGICMGVAGTLMVQRFRRSSVSGDVVLDGTISNIEREQVPKLDQIDTDINWPNLPDDWGDYDWDSYDNDLEDLKTDEIRFVIELPFEIQEEEAFTLRITAERYWKEPWGGWLRDWEFQGGVLGWLDWKAYVSTDGYNLLRQKGDLKLANGNTFYLDPQYILAGDPTWDNGRWQGDVKLLDAKADDDTKMEDFRFAVTVGLEEKGASECDIYWDLAAPCTCPCESWPGDDPSGFPCGGLAYEYVATNGFDNGILMRHSAYDSQDGSCTNVSGDCEIIEYRLKPDTTFVADSTHSCQWVGDKKTETRISFDCGATFSAWSDTSSFASYPILYLTIDNDGTCAWAIRCEGDVYTDPRIYKTVGDTPVDGYSGIGCFTDSEDGYDKKWEGQSDVSEAT